MLYNLPDDAEIGDTYITPKGVCYTFDGVKWRGSVIQQETVQGEQGPPGKDGVPGRDGAPGPAGRDGAPGRDGVDGAPGRDGVNGSAGPAGSKGDIGPQGPQGPQGPAGRDGVNGSAGPAGNKGDIGPQGPQGPQGPAGRDAIVVAAQMNYAQTIDRNSSVLRGPGIIARVRITTTGRAVLISANGDANPLINGGWCKMQLYRDETAIGVPIQAEGGNNENNPYNLSMVDAPPAGTYTYTLRMLSNSGDFQFGEAAGPVMYAIELGTAVGEAGPKGDTGPQGPAGSGIGTTLVQNSITLGSTLTAPAVGTRPVQRIESQTLGDKLKLIYKLGQTSTAAGSGDYLLTLPTGVAFNTVYHPLYTGTIWTGGVNVMAQYFIPAYGGIVIDGHWTNQIMVVPYDATRFRLAFTNNNSQTTYQFWHSGWYATSAGSGINLQLHFEIWPTTPPSASGPPRLSATNPMV